MTGRWRTEWRSGECSDGRGAYLAQRVPSTTLEETASGDLELSGERGLKSESGQARMTVTGCRMTRWDGDGTVSDA